MDYKMVFRIIGVILGAGLAGLMLVGCLPPQPPLAAPENPLFNPETFFVGSTSGTGTLHIRGRSPQTVHVRSQGERLESGAFRLDQVISIGDEDPRTRTWIMRRVASDKYEASLTDADGPVSLTIRGSELRIRYRMGSLTTMEQQLVLNQDGQSATNQATVSILGIPWARLEETIVRVRE